MVYEDSVRLGIVKDDKKKEILVSKALVNYKETRLFESL